MSWQHRDYAKWTDEERRRFLGSRPAAVRRPAAARRGLVRRPSARLAIVVAAALFALGQLPKGHPILPSLHFDLPGTHSAQVGPLRLPSTASLGSTLSLHGTAPPGNGPVTIQGSYDDGQTWETLANVGSANGTYVAQVALTQSGLLQLRVVFADGSQAAGSIRVQ
jgi:hypothetical protein